MSGSCAASLNADAITPLHATSSSQRQSQKERRIRSDRLGMGLLWKSVEPTGCGRDLYERAQNSTTSSARTLSKLARSRSNLGLVRRTCSRDLEKMWATSGSGPISTPERRLTTVAYTSRRIRAWIRSHACFNPASHPMMLTQSVDFAIAIYIFGGPRGFVPSRVYQKHGHGLHSKGVICILAPG